MFNLDLKTIFKNYNEGFDNNKLLSNLKEKISQDYKNKTISITLAPYKSIKFLNEKLGKFYAHEILLLEHELIQIYFYYLIKENYKNFSDLGANVGLHSLLASQIFKKVISYEPEINTYKSLNTNIEINDLINVSTYNKAVSVKAGQLKFFKNKENPTSNHLEISNVSTEYKDQYKNLETTNVEVESFIKILEFSDILKIDIEGHEGEIMNDLKYEYFSNKILFIEIHNNKNSIDISKFYSLNRDKIKCLLIKDGVKEIQNTDHFPQKASDGSIIFQCK